MIGRPPRDWMVTRVNPLIATKRLHLDGVGGGSNIHVIEEGPDGYLYGTSYFPNHLYRASREGTVMDDLGQHRGARGQAYSGATKGDKFHMASYPQARLSIYDPSRPNRFGAGKTNNPRDFGAIR